MQTHKAAFERLFASDHEGALRQAGPMLEADPGDITAWYVCARALLALGDRETALKSLTSLALAAAEERRPLFAIAVLKEAEEAGADCRKLASDLAARYGAKSKRLEEADIAPPPLPPRVEEGEFGEALARPDLVERVKKALAVAWGEALTLTDADRRLPYLPLFSALAGDEFVSFLGAFTRRVFEAGEIIVEQGTPGDALFVVAEGEVAIVRQDGHGGEQDLARLSSGAFFGEMALVSKAPRAAAVKALERTVILRAGKDAIEALSIRAPRLGDVLVAFCHARMLENLIRVSPVLALVPIARRPDLISRFTTDYREAGRVVVEEGTEGQGLFLIVSGQAQVSKREAGEPVVLARLGPGDIFGEISLVMRRPSTATVKALEDVALLFLSRAEFDQATRDFPGLLKSAFDIALERDARNNSILAQSAAAADDLILV